MKRALLITITLLCVSSLVVAAPGWRVTKPPVVGPNTGPDNDPAAAQGQWFIPRQSPLPVAPNRIGTTVSTWEFHDDSVPQGGGWMGFKAIQSAGVLYYDRDSGAGYNTGADGVLDTFGIVIQVTNDCPAVNPRSAGGNLHQEQRLTHQQWTCNMRDVRVTAEFALDINNGFPINAANPPYVPVPAGGIVYQAVNHSELAWYCENNDPNANFWVPAWKLDDIDHDLSASVEMQFYVGNTGLLGLGLPLRTWLDGTGDKFYNRTVSLKISDWVSPHFGPGAPYDSTELELSNVSVFFVPEPAAVLLICVGAVGLLRRRR